MDYVCLAAGKGTRLDPVTRYLQKCMHPIGTRPFVEYSLANLLQSGTVDQDKDTLTFVVGHFAEQVRSYFGDEYKGLSLRYVTQEEPLGTGHAIALARDCGAIGEEAIVWLGDLYVPAECFAALRESDEPNMLTVSRQPFKRDEHFRLDLDHEYVLRCWKGRGPYVDIGLWRLGPELISQMGKVHSDEYRALASIQQAIDDGVAVKYTKCEEWIHLGDDSPSVEKSLAKVQSLLSIL
jgi:bifunctional UDP-N-acetylglucosamine pyrophosphorylase/glucosamine-1-phosphate N-acetyltransferase